MIRDSHRAKAFLIEANFDNVSTVRMEVKQIVTDLWLGAGRVAGSDAVSRTSWLSILAEQLVLSSLNKRS
jgi:hypothetical protein